MNFETNHFPAPADPKGTFTLRALLNEQIRDLYDAAMIANAQRITHYEIAGFGTARAIADKLRLQEVAQKLGDMLASSVQADKDLTKIAAGSWISDGVNDMAAKV